MLRLGSSKITFIAVGNRAVSSLRKGASVVWLTVSSCFATGSWNNSQGWNNNDGWKN
jgi:hypothetical protein